MVTSMSSQLVQPHVGHVQLALDMGMSSTELDIEK
jgi:hypothetical protein